MTSLTVKVLDSLPDNLSLTEDVEPEAMRFCAAEKVPIGYNWGPYSVVPVRVAEMTDKDRESFWSSLETVHADWIVHLIQQTLLADYSEEETNVKIIFDKKENNILVSAKTDMSQGSDLRPDLILMDLNHKPVPSSGNCTDNPNSMLQAAHRRRMNLLNVSTSNTPSGGESALVTEEPTATAEQVDSVLPAVSGSGGGRVCKYCGISFSHLNTLEAHMAYYCSRRQASGEAAPSVGMAGSSPTGGLLTGASAHGTGTGGASGGSHRFQKAWRTRQRNRQPANLKSQSTDTSNFPNAAAAVVAAAAASGAIFSEESLKQFKIIEQEQQRAIVAAAAAAAGMCSNNSGGGGGGKKPSLSAAHSYHHSLCNGSGSQEHHHGQQQQLQQPGSSDSETEMHLSGSGAARHGSAVDVNYCAQCKLFFACRELYEVHMRLDLAALQSNPSQCGALVLAAPVMCNWGGSTKTGGRVHYVPVHPRPHTHMPPGTTVPSAGTTNNSGHVNKFGEDASATQHPSVLMPLDLSVGGAVAAAATASKASKSPQIVFSGGPDNLEQMIVAAAVRLSSSSASSSAANAVNGTTSTSSGSVAVASNDAAAAAAAAAKRPWHCHHCQTRFQQLSTFQAHQQYYCQGNNSATGTSSSSAASGLNAGAAANASIGGTGLKRKSAAASVIGCDSSSEKRSRLLQPVEESTVPPSLSPGVADESCGHWTVVTQGFRCIACGFIGQTKRGIRIHCKSQCTKRFQQQLQPPDSYMQQQQQAPVASSAYRQPSSPGTSTDIKSEDIEVCCSPVPSDPEELYSGGGSGINNNNHIKLKLEPCEAASSSSSHHSSIEVEHVK